VAECQHGQLSAPAVEEGIGVGHEVACPQLDQVCEHRIEFAITTVCKI